MFSIVSYIFRYNEGTDKLKYLAIGFFFQVYKRVVGKNIVRKLFNGKHLNLSPNCNISSMFAYTAIPNQSEVELLRSLILNSLNPHFLDIGANIGSYSVCVMDICSKIDAFEPHPFTVRRTIENFKLNGFDASHVRQVALSNKSGVTHFSDYGASSPKNRIIDAGGIEVRMTTLDEISKSLEKDDEYILKVDVEGFELQLFEGALSFFRDFKIKGILFESFDPKHVFELLGKCGFIQITEISEHNYLARR